MDKICIKNLELFARHGVYPAENELGQLFIVSATLYTDTRPAGESDDLALAINYQAVAQEIQRFLTEHTFKLLEAAAEKLAGHLLATVPGLEQITLEIKKPWAALQLHLETVSVEITRRREDQWL